MTMQQYFVKLLLLDRLVFAYHGRAARTIVTLHANPPSEYLLYVGTELNNKILDIMVLFTNGIDRYFENHIKYSLKWFAYAATA